jgi:hypothetical protein
MKLLQKLPIALSLACMMMLSSCSKEDAQTPQPQAGGVNEHSGAKTNAEGTLPFFASTNGRGEINYETYPVYWAKAPHIWGNLIAPIPAGSSSLTALWGQSVKAWAKPLPPVPCDLTANSMLTAISYTPDASEQHKRSRPFTTIRNLIPGKTYSLTFYVASTYYDDVYVSMDPAYAKSAEIRVTSSGSPTISTYIDLTGKEAQWVKKTVTFKATDTNAIFSFSGLTPGQDKFSYIHLFVNPNAITELMPFQPMVVQ